VVEKFVTHVFTFDQMLETYDTFSNAARNDALKVLIRAERD
jgi:alcohol dehydrogenase